MDLAALESALEEYAQLNSGRYPESLEELVTPDMNGYTFVKSTRIPQDPWGNDYFYDPPSSKGGRPNLYTFGKDGQRGGEDADIDSFSLRDGR